jgi:hypothetical protein
VRGDVPQACKTYQVRRLDMSSDRRVPLQIPEHPDCYSAVPRMPANRRSPICTPMWPESGGAILFSSGCPQSSNAGSLINLRLIKRTRSGLRRGKHKKIHQISFKHDTSLHHCVAFSWTNVIKEEASGGTFVRTKCGSSEVIDSRMQVRVLCNLHN